MIDTSHIEVTTVQVVQNVDADKMLSTLKWLVDRVQKLSDSPINADIQDLRESLQKQTELLSDHCTRQVTMLYSNIADASSAQMDSPLCGKASPKLQRGSSTTGYFGKPVVPASNCECITTKARSGVLLQDSWPCNKDIAPHGHTHMYEPGMSPTLRTLWAYPKILAFIAIKLLPAGAKSGVRTGPHDS